MAILQGTVGTPGNNAAGTQPNVPATPQGDIMVSELHGRFYGAARAGKLFHGCSVVGGNAIPISSATAITFMLWNTSTTVNLELLTYRLGYVSTTDVPGGVIYNYGYQGNAIGPAGAAITAFNNVPASIVPGMLSSSPAASQASFSNAATNTVKAVTTFIPGNMSQLTATAATTGNPFILQEDFEGSIIIPPGWFFFPAATAASGAVYTQRLTWAEWPI